MAIKFENDTLETKKQQELTFMQKITSLPSALKKRFFTQMAVCVAMAIIISIMALWFQKIQFCVGYLFVLYIAYLGLDIVWAFNDGKIVRQQMVCIKATKRLRQDCVRVILQETDTNKSAEERMHEFRIAATKKNLVLITENTILDVYYRPDTPMEVTAWEIIGMAN